MFFADAFAISPLKAFWSNFERMDGYVTLIHVFLFFLIMGSVLSADSLWRKWWLTFLSASGLVSLWGVMQLACAKASCGASGHLFAIHQGSERLDATMGNAEYLAAFLLFAIAIALWQAIESKKGWLQYALYALAALNTLILYYTGTRGAVLALIGGAFVAILLWAFESGKTGRRRALAALAALIIIVGGVYMARDTSWVKNQPILSRITSISLGDMKTRFTIWHMALEGFTAHPVLGWGQEGFNYVFNQYYEPSLYAQEAWFDRAHNVYLDWLIAGGLPAFLLFLALFVSAVIGVYRRETTKAERVMLGAVFAAYAIQGIVVFDNLFSYIPLAALLALAHSASSRPFVRLLKFPPVTDSVTSTIVTPVVGVVLVVVLWFVNVPNITAAGELIVGLSTQTGNLNDNIGHFKSALAAGSYGNQEIREQMVSFAALVSAQTTIPADVKAPVLTLAIDQINEELKERPTDARIYLQASVAYRAAGDMKNALKNTEAALALSPQKQQILIEDGTSNWQLGNFAKANEAFQKAYTLDTTNVDAALYAAAGDLISGSSEKGGALLMQIYGTTTVDSDILVYAYYQAKMYGEMVKVLELQFKNRPDSADAAFRLASGYVVQGRTLDARALVIKTVAAHPETATQGDQFLSQLGGN
jgi:O-antigen ligase